MKVSAQGEYGLLQAYYDAWMEYSQGITYLHQLYLYLNQQHIRKQRQTEAEIIYSTPPSSVDYGSTQDYQEQMEIGELGLDIWKKRMIEPLKSSLVDLLLKGIHMDRIGEAQSSSTKVICGIIKSFVQVEKYKVKGQLEVRSKNKKNLI